VTFEIAGEDSFMEHRKKKRFPIFLRAYCPEYEVWGHTVNVSSDGCHLRMEIPVSTGFVTRFLLELPVIGIVPLDGYVQHREDDSDDVGIELVQIKFDVEQSDYYSLYQQFVEGLGLFADIRDQYIAMVESGAVKRYAFPEEYRIENLATVTVRT
jgi:hypothetical protein